MKYGCSFCTPIFNSVKLSHCSVNEACVAGVWQIMETEKEKTVCEAEHQTKAAEYTAIQERVAYILGDIPRTINRAK